MAKNSFEKRIALGQPAVVQHLCHALAVGPPSTAQKAAQALKLLTFCHDNHRSARSARLCITARRSHLVHMSAVEACAAERRQQNCSTCLLCT